MVKKILKSTTCARLFRPQFEIKDITDYFKFASKLYQSRKYHNALA